MSDPAEYEITYTAFNALCGINEIAHTTLTIKGSITGTIVYPKSKYCRTLATPTVTVSNNDYLGSFSFTPAGLSMNLNGVINPAASTHGTYTIIYTMTDFDGCDSELTTEITIGCFHVTYDGNGNDDGDPGDDDNDYEEGDGVTVQPPPTSLEKFCHTFMGWAFDPASTVPDFAYDGVNFVPPTFTISKDTILYAVWQKNPISTCKLLNCVPLVDQIKDEDSFGTGYTHAGTDWDAETLRDIDNIEYLINGILHYFGSATSPGATLNGAHFNVGDSYVEVIGHLGTITDTCQFTVTIKRICPTEVSDFETNKYKVTEAVGYCWTENLRSTIYADGITPIAWAKQYYSVQYPDVAKHDTVFGRLYTWYSAVGNAENNNTPPTTDLNGFVQGICPNNYHLPSVAEWTLLKTKITTDKLKSTDYWIDPPGPGNNLSGFNARPAGWYKSAIDKFIDLYGCTAWWAFNDDPGQSAHIYSIFYYCEFVDDDTKMKSDGLSVRCILNY
jgi:uncharacterized protein (TIGR02145 family)